MNEIKINTCPSCGTNNINEAEFCKKCGLHLNDDKTKTKTDPRKVFFLVSIPVVLFVSILLLNWVFPLAENAKNQKIASTFAEKGFGEASILVDKYYKNDEVKRQAWILALASPDSKNQENGERDTQNLNIQDGWRWTVERNYSYIRGRVTNKGDEDINYFKITAEYMDSNGNVLDTDYTNSGETIRPGNSKEFEIMHRHSSEYEKVRIFVEEVN